MEKHHPIIVVLTVLLVLTLVVTVRNADRISGLERSTSEANRIENELFNQNQELIQANIEMRERIIELSTNLSRTQSGAQACFERLGSAFETDKSAPQTRIALDDVSFGEANVVIRAIDVTPGLIGPTGSMRPLLDEGAIVLELPVTSPADLYPGDIIIYTLDGTRVIHRIIGLGYDSLGWYAIAKGDNNPEPDPQKVRFNQISGVVGGIIY